MSHIDWQAYEDGSLSPELRAEADKLLATEPSAKAELEGLRSLKAALVKTAELETIPLDKLSRMVRKVSHPKPKWAWPVAGIAFAVLAFAGYKVWTNVMTVTFDDSPVAGQLCTGDPSAAAKFANERNGLKVQPVEPAPGYELSDVKAGNDWTMFQFTRGQTKCFLYVRKGETTFQGPPARHVAGNPVYLVHTRFGDGLGWVGGDYSYLLTGVPQEELWNLSNHFVVRGVKPYYKN
ncbi:MAG: hypothetical protein JSS66_04190 [Armatimonadetes bacterium]|nr:hypothetical protein [Armatimonadota bacterium]